MNSKWYDNIYSKAIDDPEGPIYIKQHNDFISKYCIGSVLDIGCGLGMLANSIGDNTYMGFDYSEVAIEYARDNSTNNKAAFICKDIRLLLNTPMFFDTVVLSEVLEHIDFPEELAEYANLCYIKRLIGSVPVYMPIKSHIKPRWSAEDIMHLFGINPTVMVQGCRNTKRKNIHWHFVYER